MKIRLNRDLYEEINICAKAVDETFKDYVGIVIRKFTAGKLKECSKSSELLSATSSSVVATIRDPGQTPETIRLALASCAVYVKSITPPPFIPEGKFIIGGEFE